MKKRVLSLLMALTLCLTTLPTVKTHVSHILDKLDVKRRAEAKTAAKKLHLVPDNL